jgi:hypothetical protein
LFNVLYYNMNIDKNFGQRNFVMPVTWMKLWQSILWIMILRVNKEGIFKTSRCLGFSDRDSDRGWSNDAGSGTRQWQQVMDRWRHCIVWSSVIIQP